MKAQRQHSQWKRQNQGLSLANRVPSGSCCRLPGESIHRCCSFLLANSFKIGIVALVFLLAFSTSAQAQELATVKKPNSTVEAVKSNPALNAWRQRQQQIHTALKKVSPAVVSINDGESWGSGVVVSRDGLILTAGHVILEEDARFTIFFNDGTSVEAKPLGKNLNIDAGMLKIIKKGDYPFVDIASGKPKKRGSWCIAIGHAGGFDIGRKPPVRIGRILRPEYTAYITDCAIIGGDSGGPLFDLSGSLIGIHSSIGDTIAQNRHVRIASFLKYWDRLLSGETWGNLPGTEPKKKSPEKSLPAPKSKQSAALGIEVDRTDGQAIVRGVTPGSAAERVGIRNGDIIMEFNGMRIFSPAALVQQIGKKRAGDQVKIVIKRGANTIHLDVILGRL